MKYEDVKRKLKMRLHMTKKGGARFTTSVSPFTRRDRWALGSKRPFLTMPGPAQEYDVEGTPNRSLTQKCQSSFGRL